MLLSHQDFLDFRKRTQDKIEKDLQIVLSSEELRIFGLGEILKITHNATHDKESYVSYELTEKDAVLIFLKSFKKEFEYIFSPSGLLVYFKHMIHDVNTFG